MVQKQLDAQNNYANLQQMYFYSIITKYNITYILRCII